MYVIIFIENNLIIVIEYSSSFLRKLFSNRSPAYNWLFESHVFVKDSLNELIFKCRQINQRDAWKFRQTGMTNDELRISLRTNLQNSQFLLYDQKEY